MTRKARLAVSLAVVAIGAAAVAADSIGAFRIEAPEGWRATDPGGGAVFWSPEDGVQTKRRWAELEGPLGGKIYDYLDGGEVDGKVPMIPFIASSEELWTRLKPEIEKAFDSVTYDPTAAAEEEPKLPPAAEDEERRVPGEDERTLPDEPERRLPDDEEDMLPGEEERTLPEEPERILPEEPERTLPEKEERPLPRSGGGEVR